MLLLCSNEQLCRQDTLVGFFSVRCYIPTWRRALNLHSGFDITIALIQYDFFSPCFLTLKPLILLSVIAPCHPCLCIKFPPLQFFLTSTSFFLCIKSWFCTILFLVYMSRCEKINQICKAWKTQSPFLWQQYLGSLPNCQIYSAIS